MLLCDDMINEIYGYLSLKEVVSCAKTGQRGYKCLAHYTRNIRNQYPSVDLYELYVLDTKLFPNTTTKVGHLYQINQRIHTLTNLGYEYSVVRQALINNNGNFVRLIRSLNPFNLIQQDLELVVAQARIPFTHAYLFLYMNNGDVVDAIMECTYPDKPAWAEKGEDRLMDIFFNLLTKEFNPDHFKNNLRHALNL